MREERTHGIILRTRPLTETSLIVHWLTADFGRIATVAKGARRANSPFRGKLDLFYDADLSFTRSRRSELHNLREVSLRDVNTKLREDISFLQQAAYFVALIEQATEIETPLAEIFVVMSEALQHLPLAKANPRTIFAFEIKVLSELGLMPDLETAGLSPGARQIMTRCLELPWSHLGKLKVSESQTAELRQFLHDFLLFHLGRVPSARTSALTAS